MGEKSNRCFGIFPFASNFVACGITVVALATTGWYSDDGWNYGLFQRCRTFEGTRKCKDLSGKIADRTASICLLISVAILFAASVVSCMGYTERRPNNFKVAGAFDFVAGLVTLSGTATYSVLTVTANGYHMQHSFYIAIAALICSFISSIASFMAVSRVELIPDCATKKVPEESLTDVTVLT